MQIGYKTDVGRRRQLNEDALMCYKLDAIYHSGSESVELLVVADGMGGHNAGEVASKLGIRVFLRECIRLLIEQSDRDHGVASQGINEASAREIFTTAINAANDAVCQKARDQGLHGMGTTLVAALIAEQTMYVTNVGDSRCYIITNGEITQVPKDHSLVQEMVDASMITPEEAQRHPRRNEITRAIGAHAGITGDFYFCKLYENDTILLCSDGLTSVVPDQKIAEIVRAARSPEQACNDLITAANEAGGPDNITVIVAKPEQVPPLTDIMTANTEIRRTSVEASM